MTLFPDLETVSNQTIEPKFYQQLQLLLEISGNKEIIATMLEIAEFNLNHIRWMAAPLIVHGNPWSATIPHWLPLAAYQERLEQIYQEHQNGTIGNQATAAEVLACIYPASLEAPMSHQWTNVYLWVGNEVMTKHKRLKAGQSFWEIVAGQPVNFSQIKHDFAEIATDIRSRCVNEGKNRGWCKKRKNKQTSQQETVISSNVEFAQISLF
jgi:hypothetical protein